MAEAGKTGADAGKAFHGYFYRILTGPSAPPRRLFLRDQWPHGGGSRSGRLSGPLGEFGNYDIPGRFHENARPGLGLEETLIGLLKIQVFAAHLENVTRLMLIGDLKPDPDPISWPRRLLWLRE